MVMSFIFCYNFFTNAQGPSVEVDSEPRKKGSGECKIMNRKSAPLEPIATCATIFHSLIRLKCCRGLSWFVVLML